MKVAVIYSGQPRSYDKVVDQHADFFDGFDVDTFHSTWTKSTQEERDLILKAPSIKNISYVDYNVSDRPDLIRFEKLLLNLKQNHPIFMLGRIQHMTSAALNLSWNDLIEYDYVVRMRYDFMYQGKFKKFIPKNVNNNDIFITRRMGGKSSPINVWDGFAFGKPFAMSLYFDFNKWIPFSLYNTHIQNWKYQPEFVYGTYLRHVQLNVIDCMVKPEHFYWDGMNVDDHRTTRTIQYYRDLAMFHPEWYVQKDGRLVIENDSPTVEDSLIIDTLTKEGFNCVKV